ncbi:hypothetical protein WICMUC_001912 [Wickerhamomyces mucosus]|uniref:N-acetyltransferase domain-containing protein n=1 Tax=Wickerhamomyces mucosus TaxID=1378264 RepID=A0A9P8PRM8_9ASCO|nr:hypothetical protein WICMUC_001912 [Wickerhamomyces mucosus]
MTIIYHQLNIENEDDFIAIKKLIGDDLSEPYSIYVYRFFLNQWPNLCYIAKDSNNDKVIGTIVSKLEPHRNVRLRGYIGMLVVQKEYRGQGIAKTLVKLSIDQMIEEKADEIMLETEVINKSAISLYENMGFIRSKRLFRYYMNHHDAFRLILPLTIKSTIRTTFSTPLDTLESNQDITYSTRVLSANLIVIEVDKPAPLMMSVTYLIPKVKLTALFNSTLTLFSGFSKSVTGLTIILPEPISPSATNLTISFVTKTFNESDNNAKSLAIFWKSVEGKVIMES